MAHKVDNGLYIGRSNYNNTLPSANKASVNAPEPVYINISRKELINYVQFALTVVIFIMLLNRS